MPMPRKLRLAMVCGLLAAASPAVLAQPASAEDRLLERTAVPDTTPQQRYQTAIREAGGAYKQNLAACASLATAERTGCRREAKALHDREMTDAERLLRSGARS